MLDIIKNLTAQLSSYKFINKIYLFGSRARGDHQERSDIDLAIDCPDASEMEWILMKDAINQARTLYKIDVVRFDTASAKLRDKVLEEGVILYERSKD